MIQDNTIGLFGANYVKFYFLQESNRINVRVLFDILHFVKRVVDVSSGIGLLIVVRKTSFKIGAHDAGNAARLWRERSSTGWIPVSVF